MPESPGTAQICSTSASAAAVSIIANTLTHDCSAPMSEPRLARSGPKLRTPCGGYRVAATAAAAWSADSIIAMMTASAPASSTRPIGAGSAEGNRTAVPIGTCSSRRSMVAMSASSM